MAGLLKNIQFPKDKSREKPFGLDIGDSCIRLAQLSRDAQGIKLENFAFDELPLQSDSVNSFTLVTVIRELVKKSGIDSHKVVVNLYGTDPILKFISLPSMSDEELKKTIKWEAAKFIVYDLDKMVIDYAVLNEAEEAGKKKLNVAVAASTKEFVLNEINLLREAGLEAVTIEVDTLAQLYMTKVNDVFKDNELAVLIEFGARKTSINVIDSGVPCFRRECLSIGSMDINKALKEDLNVDLLEAEKIKLNFSLNTYEPADAKEKIIHNAINKVLNHAVMEIKRSLDYYIDSFPQKTIDRIVLTGGGACFKNIDSFLSHSLGITVEVIDPFRKLHFSDNIKETDSIRTNSPRFSTVIGLALEALG